MMRKGVAGKRKLNGRLMAAGDIGMSVDPETILYRRIQIIGTVMTSRAQAEKHAMVRRFREHWLNRFSGSRRL
ncbi:hypothetical protein PSP6_210189 [Paraburkholderia tropica]|uniref:hypothetical protein n=1 Tax=Paraburkholderia tropica TaxID=92647 RepID=UPI001CAEB791|nr:hypothetical protein [Paraburkholderia tropica]CAG9202394.1 hypothetical protein PSP6_210189 [Paraburkholderia tropica]